MGVVKMKDKRALKKKDKRTLIILNIIFGIFSIALSVFVFIESNFGKTDTIRFRGMYIGVFGTLVFGVSYSHFYCKIRDFERLPLLLRIISCIIAFLPMFSALILSSWLDALGLLDILKEKVKSYR